MVKKFKEFIGESLWKKGIERSKTGEDRLGDKITIEMAADCFDIDLNKYNIYPIEGYKGYFVVIYLYDPKEEIYVEAYHYPNEIPICTFLSSYETKNIPQINLQPNTEFFGINDMPKEDMKIFDSDEFISAINNTLLKNYK